MAETTYSAEDFAPAPALATAQSISRPSLSYWQDAWLRLKANRRALFSLYIVVALLAFTLVGPFVWRLDPALQDLEQISQPPGADRNATIVEPYRPWNGDDAPTTASLRLGRTAQHASGAAGLGALARRRRLPPVPQHLSRRP